MDLNLSDTNFNLPHDIFLYHLFFLLKCIDLYKFKYLSKSYYNLLTPALFRKNVLFHLNKKLAKIFGGGLDSFKKTMEDENCILFGDILLKSMLGKQYDNINEKLLKIKDRVLLNEYKTMILKDVLGIKKFEKISQEIKVEKKNIYSGMQIAITHVENNYDEKSEISKKLEDFLFVDFNFLWNNFAKFTSYENDMKYDFYQIGFINIKYIQTYKLELDIIKKVGHLNLWINFQDNYYRILNILFHQNHYFIENGIEIVEIYEFNKMMKIINCLLKCEKPEEKGFVEIFCND